MSQILAGTDPQAIATAAALLRAGEVVAFPTETVYGLGANALNERAVAQVFAIKNRPHFDPLIVHVPDKDTVALYATGIDERAAVLMERFWPGPLTLVLRKRPNIPDLVTAGLDTVAIRVPAHPVALALLRAAQVPVAAPSANPFGYVSPTTALHVQELLGKAIPLILDGGPCTVGVESTVCALTEPQAASMLVLPALRRELVGADAIPLQPKNYTDVARIYATKLGETQGGIRGLIELFREMNPARITNTWTTAQYYSRFHLLLIEDTVLAVSQMRPDDPVPVTVTA